jgi:uncharacterized repeat protein (TIGR01451 family)
MKKQLFSFILLNLFAIILVKGQINENNGICNDPIAGIGTYINGARTTGINLLGGVSSANNIIDGDLRNHAEINLGVALVGGQGSISVRDSIHVYPSGNRVGFVIRPTGGIISAGVLSSLTINLYRNGTLVQTATGGSLLYLGLLNGSGNKHKIGFTATAAYDEIQLIASSGLVGILSGLQVYYAFEEPTACIQNPEKALKTSVVSNGISGLCALCSVNNPNNVVNNDTTTHSSIYLTIGAGVSGRISVSTGIEKAGGTEFGWVIENSGGILDAALLGRITFSTYLGGNLQQSFIANSSIISLSILGGNRRMISFTTASDKNFDEVRISVNSVVGLLTNLNVYYAFTRTDTDGDGIYDPMDKCSGGNDLLDNDGDGIPDYCDTDDDNDGLTDAEEAIAGTDPFDGDTDDDGLTDFQELRGTGPLAAWGTTNALNRDSDGDGILDGTEVGLTHGTHYTNPAVFVADLDPTTKTNPKAFDTDGDGLSDGQEDANRNGRVDAGESDPNNPCDPNACPVDLEVTKTVDKLTAEIGDNLIYTIGVKNLHDSLDVTGLVVRDQLPNGVTYVSHTAFAGTSYDPATGLWNIDDVMSNAVDSVGLTITVAVTTSGVISNLAEVLTLNETDADSTNNFARVSTSVAYALCAGDSLEIHVPQGYTSYQWLKDGSPIAGATSYNYWVTETGDYTVSIDGGSSCTSGLCSPFSVVVGTPAPVTIAGTAQLCSDDALNLTASSTETITSYLWRAPNGSTSTAAAFSIASANTSQSGNYTLEVTYASGCVARDTFNVAVNQSILAANITTICNDNGTSGDASDDIFTVRINPSGGSPGGTYSISDGITQAGLSFGTASTLNGSFLISGGPIAIRITDNASGCSLAATVTPPATCSSCVEICIPIELTKTR